jgi:V8-like Glu-specific endopeptidase
LSTEEVSGLFQPPQRTDLRDIAEASFGAPPPREETVHGPDDRIQITDTRSYPWRAHASLLITAADNSQWIGTGWFIGPHTLMTAGHVVFIKNSGVAGRDGWVRNIQVMPGRNSSTLPYGSVTSTSFRSVNGWTNSGDPNYDYGAIIIPTDLGNTVGWFGFGVYSDSDLLTVTGNISGYPGDKPGGTQWYDARRIASVDTRKVYYDIDTAGGQSGSAVYRIVNGNRYAIGIHAYGGAVTNSGTRIVTPVYNNMLAWKA